VYRNEAQAASGTRSTLSKTKSKKTSATPAQKGGLKTELPNRTGRSVFKPAEEGALGVSRVSSSESSVASDTKVTENHVLFSVNESEFVPVVNNLSEDLGIPVNNVSEFAGLLWMKYQRKSFLNVRKMGFRRLSDPNYKQTSLGI
jgi:hypothetical protein